jgi:hypothetical protein
MRFPLTMFAVAAVSFGAGYAVFRTRTGGAVANVIEVASWRLPSAGAGDDRRTSAQKLDDLLALTKKPATLARDRALFAAINALSAHDLRALSTDVMALLERFEKLPQDLQGMLAEATMDRWLEIDAESALAWVKAARSIAETVLRPDQGLYSNNLAFGGMVTALARHQPDWLLENAREISSKLGREAAIQSAIAQLAMIDIADARRRVGTLDEIDGRAATQGLLQSLVRTDPISAVTLALSLPKTQMFDDGILRVMFAADENGSAVLAQIIRLLPAEQRGKAWIGLGRLAGSEPAATRELFDRLQSENQLAPESYAPSVGARLAESDPDATAKWMTEWNPQMREATGVNFRHSFVRRWVESDPIAALAWATGQPQSSDELQFGPDWTNDDLVKMGLQHWLAEDRTAANAWIEALPSGAVRERANQALAQNLLGAGDVVAAAEAYVSGAANDTRGDLGQRVASAFASKDASAAAEWSLTLPAGAARVSAIKSTAAAWLAKDPSAAVAWFGQLPPGSDRDAGASALAAATIHADSSAAVEWVEQIADSKARANAAAAVFGTWTWTDPQGARSWLRNLNGVDEQWKEAFLRRAR